MNIRRVKYKDIEQIPKLRVKTNFKKDFMGSAPAPFIGRIGYPFVNIGVLSPQIQGDTSYYDSPHQWSANAESIGTIASMRYGLVNSRDKGHIKGVVGNKKLLEACQEVGMAAKPVELEVNLQKKPELTMKSEREIKPFGPGASIERLRVTSNSRVDTRVARVVDDTDLKSVKGIVSLYKKGFEESSLNKLLSVGNLGIGKNRKLVPTRWSITAVDDTVGKQLIKEVKDYSVGDFRVYTGGGWGNYYVILFFSDVWSYELFETYLDKKINPWSKNSYMYSTDYEPYKGRKKYAEETAGGYYACRIGILDKLKELKRQGSVLALRFITPVYNVPLGVWVCREATRKALDKKPIEFSSQELMVSYVTSLVKRKFGFDVSVLLKKSLLLKNKKEQTKLFEF